MSIYPDKRNGQHTGRWAVEVMVNRKKRKGRANSYAEAQQLEQKLHQELAGETGEASTRAAQKPVKQSQAKLKPNRPKTIGEAITKYGRHIWDIEDSPKRYKEVVEKRWPALKRHVGDIPIDVDRTGLLEIVDDLRDKADASGSTINRYLSVINKVLVEAKDLGWIDEVPRMPRKSEGESRMRVMSHEEEALLFDYLGGSPYYNAQVCADLFFCLLYTGCRCGEVLHAEPWQIKGDWLYLPETKTEKGAWVPLPPKVRETLKARLPWPIQYHNAQQWWSYAKKAIGLGDDPEFVIHCLRHTCASRLINEENWNLKVVQQILRHSKIETTAKYAHADNSHLLSAVCSIADNRAEREENVVGKSVGEITPLPPQEAA